MRKKRTRKNEWRMFELRVLRYKKAKEMYAKLSARQKFGAQELSNERIIGEIEENTYILGDYIWKILQGQYDHMIAKYDAMIAERKKNPEIPQQVKLEL